MFATFTDDGASRVIATAVHDGHELRPELERISTLDERVRLREEDPHTGDVAARFGHSVVVHRSRFEVDLNRERSNAVYREPSDAWGLELWKYPLTPEIIEQSLQLHDTFYSNLGIALDEMVESHGGFVLYDLHAYNHRRQGPEAPPDDEAANPTINLGTGSMPGRWRRVADAFLETMRSRKLDGEAIDARENIKFNGRAVAAFAHARHGDRGCALAIELKKVFMDEWSGELFEDTYRQLTEAVLATMEPVLEAWSSSVRQ